MTRSLQSINKRANAQRLAESKLLQAAGGYHGSLQPTKANHK